MSGHVIMDANLFNVAYVALTLELEGDLWTSDAALETGLRKKRFTRFFVPPQT